MTRPDNSLAQRLDGPLVLLTIKFQTTLTPSNERFRVGVETNQHNKVVFFITDVAGALLFKSSMHPESFARN